MKVTFLSFMLCLLLYFSLLFLAFHDALHIILGGGGGRVQYVPVGRGQQRRGGELSCCCRYVHCTVHAVWYTRLMGPWHAHIHPKNHEYVPVRIPTTHIHYTWRESESRIPPVRSSRKEPHIRYRSTTVVHKKSLCT